MKKLIFVFVLLFARPVVAGDLFDAIASIAAMELPAPDPQEMHVATYGPLEDALQSCANGNCPLRFTPVRSVSRAGAAVASRSVQATVSRGVQRLRVLRGRRGWFPRLRAWRARGARWGRARGGC